MVQQMSGVSPDLKKLSTFRSVLQQRICADDRSAHESDDAIQIQARACAPDKPSFQVTLVHSGKMHRCGEASGKCNLRNSDCCLTQQDPGMFRLNEHVTTMDGCAEMLSKITVRAAEVRYRRVS